MEGRVIAGVTGTSDRRLAIDTPRDHNRIVQCHGS
jgi:hypothetical protein